MRATFADLAADTAVRVDPEMPGRYRVALPDHWDYLRPSGGAVMTCALRAAEAALADAQLRLVSATTIFCTPIAAGALVADVAVLRRGGSTAQVRVAMRHAEPPPDGDNSGLELVATFCRERKGPDVKGVPFPPDVRSLEDSLPVEDGAANNPHGRYRFYEHLDCRIAHGDRYWSADWSAGPARYARWFRYRVPQRDAQGRFDRLALPPIVDTMPTALHRVFGPSPYRFYAPSLDLTAYVVDDTAREWLLVDTRLRRAHLGVAIADCEIWDDEGRYLGHAAQAMYIHGVAGGPTPVDASGRL